MGKRERYTDTKLTRRINKEYCFGYRRKKNFKVETNRALESHTKFRNCMNK